MAATLVLVHGAWHGAWCWAAVQRRLDDARIVHVAVDNPSAARSPSDLHDDADNVRAVLDAIDGPVVLVGHSYGGAIVTDAGTHGNVTHLVYVSAFALDDGESVTQNDLPDGEVGGALEAALRFDGAVVELDRELAVPALYHDCAPAVADDAAARLRPQSVAALRGTPRHVAWREKPSTYVVCTDDRALTPALQRSNAARTGGIVDWPTSHSPFLSRPDLVAELLIDLSSR